MPTVNYGRNGLPTARRIMTTSEPCSSWSPVRGQWTVYRESPNGDVPVHTTADIKEAKAWRDTLNAFQTDSGDRYYFTRTD